METGLQDSPANKLLETAYLSLLFYISAILGEMGRYMSEHDIVSSICVV